MEERQEEELDECSSWEDAATEPLPCAEQPCAEGSMAPLRRLPHPHRVNCSCLGLVEAVPRVRPSADVDLADEVHLFTADECVSVDGEDELPRVGFR